MATQRDVIVAHTPGPWRVGTSYGAVITDVEHDGVWTDPENRTGYGGFLVCESVRSEANARLIAAAPELLAACKAALDGDGVSDPVRQQIIDAVEKARKPDHASEATSDRIAVRSSNIARIGFDLTDAARLRYGILTVEFMSGAIYRYFDVPASMHEALLAAPSVGTYFTHAIKHGGFKFEKLAAVVTDGRS